MSSYAYRQMCEILGKDPDKFPNNTTKGEIRISRLFMLRIKSELRAAALEELRPPVADRFGVPSPVSRIQNTLGI